MPMGSILKFICFYFTSDLDIGQTFTISSASAKGSTNTCAFWMIISSMGLSLLSVSTLSIALSVVSAPPTILPKIECFPSKCLHERNVMKL